MAKQAKKPVAFRKTGEFSPEKVFKAHRDANELCVSFDKNNGDFDTLEEFVRAYLENDRRALDTMHLQNMEQLFDVIETMSPEIAREIHGRVPSVEQMHCRIDEMRRAYEDEQLAPAA